MKRYGNLYEQVCTTENIINAMNYAAKGKRTRSGVRRIFQHEIYFLNQLQEIFKKEEFIPSEYEIKIIYDGNSKKERTIKKPKFYPDQIVHWMIMNILEPILINGMYEHSCGSIPGKGIGWGKKYISKWLREDYKNTKYCLKLDIRKFYDSVDHDSLKRAFINKIKDEKMLNLIFKIIDSSEGLPIGNYTSQWFANFLLTPLDFFIKHELKIPYYIRYVDDMVLSGPNKRKLHKAKITIEKYLRDNFKLSLKSNWQLFKVDSRGIDFLGYRFFRDKIILRKSNSLRIRRRFKKIENKFKLNYKDASAIISYHGMMRKTDSYTFYNKKIYRHKVTMKNAKKIVSEYFKSKNKGDDK